MAYDSSRVLIADDDASPRQLLTHYLKSWGFTVTVCHDGIAALQILSGDNPPSLALLDWAMPGLEGVEVIRRVRALSGRRPYVYLIMVTGSDDVAAGLQAGADDFLTKPYAVEELRARLSVGQRVIGLERRLAENIEMLREALDHAVQLPNGASACICPVCRQPHERGEEL